MTKVLRALIVDDEPLGRRRVRSLLDADPGIEVVGEAGDAAGAVAAIRREEPDIVFLDIELPERDGFSVIDEIGIDDMPFVLFVTAFDEHAVRAFEVEAIDYVVKPFTNERFRAALQRARGVVAAREALARWREAVTRSRAPAIVEGRLTVRQGDRYVMLDVSEVEAVTAEGNYVRIHAPERGYLMRGTITTYEEALAPHGFRRTHRTTLVNLRSIRYIERMFHGDFAIVLRSGNRLKLSRRYRGNVPGLEAE
jgi:two-component system LytT family response regulator